MTRLTRREAQGMAVILCNNADVPRLPHGVYRALVIRGLLTAKHELTDEGRAAFDHCELLSRHFRDVLLGGQPWMGAHHGRKQQRARAQG